MSQIADSARNLLVYREHFSHRSTDDSSFTAQKAFIHQEIL